MELENYFHVRIHENCTLVYDYQNTNIRKLMKLKELNLSGQT